MLHVLESCAPGGMETTFLHVLRACRALDPEIGHDVLAFSGGALEPAFRSAADRVVIGCDSATLDAHVARSHDVVHLLFERCAYRLLPQLVANSSARIVYGKGYDMGGMYRLNEGLQWQADESMLAACDAATFTTPQLAAGYVMPDDDRTTILRKAADIARFSAIGEPEPGVAPRIISVANLHPRKRLGDLIVALHAIRQVIPDAELRLVGGGNIAERERLVTLAADRGLTEAVSFAGTSANVAAEMAAARVMALPSSCEGVPTVLLEAMAAGRPVVATDVGHVTSIVDDGVEGYVVEVGDLDALVDRLVRVLGNPAFAARMGAAGRLRAARHDASAVAADLLAALKAA